MSSTIEIDGKKLLPVKEVVKQVSYSRDYITRLAREGKIVATNVSRQWFVDFESLTSYVEQAALEAELRKKHLSEERKKEQLIVSAKAEKKNIREQKLKTLNLQATAVASLVLSLGLMGGLATHYFLNGNNNPESLAASTFEITESSNVASVPTPDTADSLNATPAQNLSAHPQESIRPIGDDIESGVLLLPHGSIEATPEELFSDEVEILTSSNGTQMVVQVDKDGRPVGRVIPFVEVPVNHSDI